MPGFVCIRNKLFSKEWWLFNRINSVCVCSNRRACRTICHSIVVCEKIYWLKRTKRYPVIAVIQLNVLRLCVRMQTQYVHTIPANNFVEHLKQKRIVLEKEKRNIGGKRHTHSRAEWCVSVVEKRMENEFSSVWKGGCVWPHLCFAAIGRALEAKTSKGPRWKCIRHTRTSSTLILVRATRYNRFEYFYDSLNYTLL